MTKQVQEDSAAQATLHPQNKSTMLNSALLKMSGMSIEDLSKFHNEVIAQIGHEADGVKDLSGSNQSSLNMKPSAASTAMKESVAEDMAAVLEGEELSEEFKTNVSTLFESALEARLVIERAELVEEMQDKLDEAYDTMAEEMSTKLDAYLDTVVEKWLADNEVAIESALRNEMMDDFLVGLQSLFAEHYIDMPEDKVNVVEELAAKVADLESRLDTSITENASLKSENLASKKADAINSVCEGMVLTTAQKVRELAESVEFNGDVDAFTAKVNTIKENVANKATQTPSTGILTEESDPDAAANGNAPAPGIDPQMARYMSAISRNVR